MVHKRMTTPRLFAATTGLSWRQETGTMGTPIAAQKKKGANTLCGQDSTDLAISPNHHIPRIFDGLFFDHCSVRSFSFSVAYERPPVPNRFDVKMVGASIDDLQEFT